MEDDHVTLLISRGHIGGQIQPQDTYSEHLLIRLCHFDKDTGVCVGPGRSNHLHLAHVVVQGRHEPVGLREELLKAVHG